MSTDLMPNRYRAGESDLPRRESELIARRDQVLGASYRLQYRRPELLTIRNSLGFECANIVHLSRK